MLSPEPLRPAAPSARRRLDVLIPSHNRAALLEKAVRSVLDCAPHPSLDVRVTVVLNGCSDESPERLLALQREYPGRLWWIAERRRGKSLALNAGLAATSGELVAMIDDDEQVHPAWLGIIARTLRDDTIEFIGGPYVACWDGPPPSWVPADYLAVLGSANNGSVAREYGPGFQGILKGGNAVVRRRTLDRLGPYAEQLGPGGFSRLFSCEDEEMYLRLLEDGARGVYVPELVVFHYVPTSRLTRAYYRRWCFWRGVSRGLMDHRHPLPVTYLAGVPRFIVGQAARSLLRLAAGLVRRQPPAERMGDELRSWDLAGYFFGKHLYPLARFAPMRNRRRGDAAWFLPRESAAAAAIRRGAAPEETTVPAEAAKDIVLPA